MKKISEDELARKFPVNPLTVKRNTKPRTHTIAWDHLMLLSRGIANQLNIFTLVGLVIIIVADVNRLVC